MIDAAIVGLGRWGQALVGAVQGKSAAIRFTRAVTRTPAAAEAFAKVNGLPVSTDYAALLKDPAIKAIVLATPHSLHEAQIIAAAAAGKHVFAEKPFTLTKESAERALAACRKANVAVGLGLNRRFLPALREMKKIVHEGSLGTLLHLEANFTASLVGNTGLWRASRSESPAGGMTSLGIHALDAMIHLCGPMTEVVCWSQRRAMPFDVDDTTVMLLRFQSGLTGYLGTMALGGRLWQLRVFGEKGWVEMRSEHALVRCMAAGGVAPSGAEEITNFPIEDSLKSELEAFALACAGGPAFPIPPSEIAHGVAVLEAIDASARAGGKLVRVA